MKVLYLAQASPWPPRFGVSLRTAAVFAALERSADVRLLVIGDEPGTEARAWLAERGAGLWTTAFESVAWRGLRIAVAAATGKSIPAARLYHHGGVRRLGRFVGDSRPDVVVFGDTFLAEAAPVVHGLGIPLVIDTHNVESLLWQEIAAISPGLLARAGAKLLSANTLALEKRALPLARRVWAASDVDAAWYRRELGTSTVDVVPNAITASYALGDAVESNSMMMSGLFAYPPNEDAALQLIASSRALAADGVDHRLYLVGYSPTPRMFAAARSMPQIEITGEVPSIEPWLRRAAIVVAPLRAGSGTKFKLVQAMLAGRPVVTTETGARGLGLQHGRDAWIVDAEDFTAGIRRLLGDAPLRARLADAARRHALRHFTQEGVDAVVRGALAAVAAA